MVQYFIDGGGFMWPILGIGAIGLIFVGERLFHLISGLQANEAFPGIHQFPSEIMKRGPFLCKNHEIGVKHTKLHREYAKR